MVRREFCMLAEPWEPLKHKTDGSYISEKLDGMRCVWMPETRGMNFQEVPFANTNKDDRDHVSTGLWTRYGKPIFAPAWFLDQLPGGHMLDGELWAGYGNFQRVMSFAKKHVSVDAEWRQLGYYAFDIPGYAAFMTPGRINNPNMAEKIIPENMHHKFDISVTHPWWNSRRFEGVYNYLKTKLPTAEPRDVLTSGGVYLLAQEQLPFSRFAAEKVVEDRLPEVNARGSEGLILRRPHSEWRPKRTSELMKVKPEQDAEGTIKGYTYGYGKLVGLFGSMRIQANLGNGPVEFDLSGFTDAERALKPEYRRDANLLPGNFVKQDVADQFQLDQSVTFKYRELTRDGMPKEARYYRVHETSTI